MALKSISFPRRSADADRVAIISLGLMRPRLGEHEMRSALARVPADERATLLRRNLCAVLAVQRLREFGFEPDGRTDFGTSLEEHANFIGRLIAAVPATIELVDGVANTVGLPSWLIKGSVARTMYPDPTVRDLGDLDIMVHDVSAASVLTRELRARGYAYEPRELPWIKFDPLDGTTYGQVNLRSPDRDSVLSVDIHFGGYSVRHCVRVPDVPDRDAKPGLVTSPLETWVMQMLGNGAGDLAVTAKDINDLTQALHRDDTDWDRVAHAARTAGLRPFLSAVAERTRSLVDLDPAAAARAERLSGRVREPIPWSGRGSARTRVAMTVAHAGLVGARGGGPGVGVSAALSAYRYYASALNLGVRPNDAAENTLRLDRETCVRLVPVDTACDVVAGGRGDEPTRRPPGAASGSGRLAWTPGEHGYAVHLAGELFVPTVDYQLSPQHVASVASTPDLS